MPLVLCFFTQCVFLSACGSDHCRGAGPGAGEALEGRAGCEEVNRGAKVPADKGQGGKRPAVHGRARHRPVRGEKHCCTLRHTNFHTASLKRI